MLITASFRDHNDFSPVLILRTRSIHFITADQLKIPYLSVGKKKTGIRPLFLIEKTHQKYCELFFSQTDFPERTLEKKFTE